MEMENLDNLNRPRTIWRYSREGWQTVDSLLAAEFAATIYFNGRELVTLLCTPEHLEDLAVGFLAGEGLLIDPGDLETVKADYERGQVWVASRSTSMLAEKTFMKRYLTTGCGKGTSFYNLDDSRRAIPLKRTLRITPEQVGALMRSFQEGSVLYRLTGGVHNAALCRPDSIVIQREDLGRHNAVDKLVGCCMRQGIDPGSFCLMTTGRISSEIMLKTIKAGIEVLISRSAPTSLALDLADELGMTVIGYARGGRFNVYSHPQRVTSEEGMI